MLQTRYKMNFYKVINESIVNQINSDKNNFCHFECFRFSEGVLRFPLNIRQQLLIYICHDICLQLKRCTVVCE